MNQFIEDNKKLLVFYFWAARIGGWIFVTLGILVVIGHSIALLTRLGDPGEFTRYFKHDVPWPTISNVLPTGLLVLGVSQLIWYLLDSDHQARWLLRNADKLLYLYTAVLVGYYCWAGVIDVRLHIREPYDFPWRMILVGIFVCVKLLALVGVAEIVRRMLPVLEEHRTLV